MERMMVWRWSMMQTEALPDKLHKSQVLHDEHWHNLLSFYALSQPTVCTDDPAD